MSGERDERWVLFALAAIAVGYFIFLKHDVIQLDRRLISKLGSAIPYGAAPLFAVLSAIWKKRKAAEARRQWDEGALREGIVREETGVNVRFVNGKRTRPFRADVRLTRSAFYVLDKSGKRDPMRFVINLESVNELGVFDARLDRRGGGPVTVTVQIVGKAKMGVELTSVNSEGWWVDIRRALRLSSDPRYSDLIDNDTAE
ncbi:hypothetical protein H8D73_00150 [bacterium]|nr:hypothetical protein [bacterium]